MNNASKDMGRHLGVLLDKLNHPTDYELAFSYFLDEFSGDLGFHAEGTRHDATHLRAALNGICMKAMGAPVRIEKFGCSFLHAHDFFHGHAEAPNAIIVFFYFATANVGLAAVMGSNQSPQVARFRLPGAVAGNPGYN